MWSASVSTGSMQVRVWKQDVLLWLNKLQPDQIASSVGQGQCRIIACFAAWVKLGALIEVDAAYTSKFIDLALQLSTSQSEGMCSAVLPDRACWCTEA